MEGVLVTNFAKDPYQNALPFVASIHETAAASHKHSDLVGMQAVTNGEPSTTLIGLMALQRIATAEDRTPFFNRVNRPLQYRGDLVNEETPPEAATPAEEESKKFDRSCKTWEKAQEAYEKLRSTVITNLPPQMQEQVLSAVPRLEVVDIIALIRREYIDTVPTFVVEKWIAKLSTPLQPTETIEGAILQFTTDLQRIPIDNRPKNHYAVTAFVGKLRGPELAAVTTALDIFFPTDHSRHWNDAIKTLIRDQILGAREHAPATIGQTLAHNVITTTTTETPTATAAAASSTQHPTPKPPPKLQGQHYCFAHGRCAHTSFACSKMEQDYGSATNGNNAHLAKFLCTTGGQNIDGVVSSARVPDAARNNRLGSRGAKHSNK